MRAISKAKNTHKITLFPPTSISFFLSLYLTSLSLADEILDFRGMRNSGCAVRGAEKDIGQKEPGSGQVYPSSS